MGTRLKQYKCLNARVTCEKGAFSEWGVRWAGATSREEKLSGDF